MIAQTNNGLEIVEWLALPTLTPDATSAVAPVLATAANGGLTFANGLATMVCAAAHGLYNGQMVCIYGATDAGYNCYAPATILSPTSFSYPLPGAATTKWVGGQPQGPGAAPNLGTLVITPANYTVATTPDAGNALVSSLKVRKALFSCPVTNGGTVAIGPIQLSATPFVLTSAPTAIVLGAGQTYELTAPYDPRGNFAACFDLAAWIAKSSAAGLKLNVLYLP